MKKNFLIFILLAECASAQSDDILQLMKKIPSANSKTIETVVDYIKNNTANEREKAYAVYCFVSLNIRYDAKKFFKDEASYTEPTEIFKKKKAVCEGYSNLVKDMCTKLGLHCERVTGFSKGYGYVSGQQFTDADHAWNAVKYDSAWHLIDATWGAGYLKKKKFKKKFDNAFFTQPPKEFILLHGPETPMWQLLDHPVTMKTFTAGDKKIAEHFKSPPNTAKYNFSDTINFYRNLSEEKKILEYGRMAIQYNNKNTIPLAFGILIQSSKTLQETKDPQTKMLDSISSIVNGAIALLKKSRSTRAATQTEIEHNLKTAGKLACAIYIEKCVPTEKKYLTDSLPLSFDSLCIVSSFLVGNYSLALQSAKESQDDQFHEEVNDRFCELQFFLSRKFILFLERESDLKKKKIIEGKISSQINNAKKIARPGTRCYKAIQVVK